MSDNMAQRFRILLVEDSLEESLLVQALVEREGLGEVLAVQDGLAGAERVQDGLFDLIICDLNLPGFDGIGVVRAAKQAHPERPIIVTTGYHDSELHSRARAGGADRVFTKPLDRDTFLEALRSLLPAAPHGPSEPLAADDDPASGDHVQEAGSDGPPPERWYSRSDETASDPRDTEDDVGPEVGSDPAESLHDLVMEDPSVPSVTSLGELRLMGLGDVKDRGAPRHVSVQVDDLIVDLGERSGPESPAPMDDLPGAADPDERPQTVLAVEAVPGDVILACGGLLAGHARDGWTIVILSLTRRFGSLPDLGSAAHQAARRLGAKLVLGDVQPGDDERALSLVSSLIELHRPDTVLTPSLHDRNDARVDAHDAVVEATPATSHVYAYQTPTTGLGFRPHLFANVEELLDLKMRALEPFAEYEELVHLTAKQARDSARYWGRHADHEQVEPLELIWSPSEEVDEAQPDAAASAHPEEPVLVVALEAVPQFEVAPVGEASPQVETAPTNEAAPTVEVAPSFEVAPTVEVAPTLEGPPTVEVAPTLQGPPTVEVAPSVEVQATDMPAPTSSEAAVAVDEDEPQVIETVWETLEFE